MKPAVLVIGPPYPSFLAGETILTSIDQGAGPLEAATLLATAEASPVGDGVGPSASSLLQAPRPAHTSAAANRDVVM